MPDTTHNDYSVSQEGKQIKELDKLLARIRPQVVARYGEAAVYLSHQQEGRIMHCPVPKGETV